MIAFFWNALASLLDAWQLPEYSHGYLIPPIAFYLFLMLLPPAAGEGDGAAARGADGALPWWCSGSCSACSAIWWASPTSPHTV